MSALIDFSINKANKKMKRDKIEKWVLSHKLKILPSHPFRLGVFGPSGCGKTNLFIKLLTTKHWLFNYFHRIMIFSPTFSNEDCWDVFQRKHDPERKGNKKLITSWEQYDRIDEKAIEHMMQSQKDEIAKEGIHKSDTVLLIFDDCFGEKELSGPLLKKLMFQGRHYNCSIAFLGQSYMKLPRDLRLQLTNVIIFSPNRSEVERIAEDHENLYASKKDVENMIMNSCKEKYSFLHINKQDEMAKSFRKKFDEIYLLE